MALATPAPRVLAYFATRTVITQIALVVGGAAFVGIAAQIASLDGARKSSTCHDKPFV